MRNIKKILEKARTHKEVSKITKVEEDRDDYSITKSDGWSFNIPKKYGIVPKVGDEATFYGNPFKRVQGVDIAGNEVFFMTQTELNVEHKAFCKKFHEDNLQKYQEIMEKIKNDEMFETIDISGMTGSYEWGCQMMLRAGIKFLEDHPNFHFDYQGFKGVYGVCYTDTPWGKELDKAISNVVNDGATGAMHQAVINHLMYIQKHGYEKWLKSVPIERIYTYPSGLPSPKESITV